MIAVLVAVAAGAGTYLLWFTPTAKDRRAHRGAHFAQRSGEWLTQAGLADVRPTEFLVVAAGLGLLGFAGGFALFGSLVPACGIGVGAAYTPLHVYRGRRAARLAHANEAWPAIIEEIRIHTGNLGRSIPQSLHEAGRRAPADLQPAFAAAHREWLITTDFPRTLDVLKARLADPTADATCETLLVAHEVGGTDLSRRLGALAEDRTADADARRDARAKQAGVRLARRFVLVVPAGMAFAGSLIGNSRAAYGTSLGQVVVLIALGLVAACWAWAGRYLRLPRSARVFRETASDL